MTRGAVVVAGGTGLVGSALLDTLLRAGRSVTLISRRPDRIAPRQGLFVVDWSDLPTALDGASAVVNLCGEGIADAPWTPTRKLALTRSRLLPTAMLVGAMAQSVSAPPVLINASAIGIYKGDQPEFQTEESPLALDFLGMLCQSWESEATKAESLGVRVVTLRTGIVLAPDGGALPRMAAPFRAFAGCPLGSGTQGMSWIHLRDLVGLLTWAIESPEVSGPLNGTAPTPTTNRDFSRTLAKVLHRPCWPVPGFLTAPALRLFLGEMAEAMLLQGPKVRPAKALDLGFQFQFPDLEPALRDVLGR